MDRSKWKRTRFGDLVRCVDKTCRDPEAEGLTRVVGLEHLDPGELRISRWADVADGTSFTRTFRTGQVLFGKRRAYQRKAARPDFDGICSGDILVFEADPIQLVPELLPFLVASSAFFDHAIGTSAGSLSPRTKWKELAEYQLLIPPEKEQHNLSRLLQQVEATRSSWHVVADELRRLRDAAFLNAVSEIAQRGECVYTMRSLLVAEPESGFSATAVDEDTGVYVLALSAICAEGYRSGEVKPVRDSKKVESTRLASGDFLITRSNTLELVGLVGIVEEHLERVSFPDTMMRLRVNPQIIRPRFLEAFLLSEEGRRRVRRIAAGTSDSMKKINKKNLGQVEIAVPSLGQQDDILAQRQEIAGRVFEAEAHAERLKGIIRSITDCFGVGQANV